MIPDKIKKYLADIIIIGNDIKYGKAITRAEREIVADKIEDNVNKITEELLIFCSDFIIKNGGS